MYNWRERLRNRIELNHFNLKYLDHIENPVPSWELLHTHIDVILYNTSIWKVEVSHNLWKLMAGTLQLLPTANSRADRSSLSVKLVALAMFTHFEFSTKAISKALPYSNLTKYGWHISFSVLKHVVLNYKMITRSLKWGEKSSLEQYMAITLLCFWQRDSHLYLSNTWLSWLSSWNCSTSQFTGLFLKTLSKSPLIRNLWVI